MGSECQCARETAWPLHTRNRQLRQGGGPHKGGGIRREAERRYNKPNLRLFTGSSGQVSVRASSHLPSRLGSRPDPSQSSHDQKQFSRDQSWGDAGLAKGKSPPVPAVPEELGYLLGRGVGPARL